MGKTKSAYVILVVKHHRIHLIRR